jgi:hypothetical protein
MNASTSPGCSIAFRVIRPNVYERDALGQRDGYLFRPAALLYSTAYPLDVRRRYAIVFEHRARPYIGRKLPFGNTDPSPSEVLGRPYPTVSANDDRGMPEGAGNKRRYPDVGQSPLAVRRTVKLLNESSQISKASCFIAGKISPPGRASSRRARYRRSGLRRQIKGRLRS